MNQQLSPEWEKHMQFDIPYPEYETLMQSIMGGGNLPPELRDAGVQKLQVDETIIIRPGTGEWDNDVTLREADQAPESALSDWQKTKVAGLMVDSGAIGRMEVGFASPNDIIVPSIIGTYGSVDHVRFGVLTLANQEFVQRAAGYLQNAKKSCIHIFFPSHPAHAAMEVTTAEERGTIGLPSVHEVTQRSIDRIIPNIVEARNHTDCVEFTPEIGVDTDPTTLSIYVREAIKAGATIINVPGTRGDGPPEYRQTLFRFLHFATRDLRENHSFVLTCHEHNDLGTALDSSVQAVSGGADGVESTFGGYGEGGGNTETAEAYAQRMNRRLPGKFDPQTLAQIVRIRKFVTACVGIPRPESFTPKHHGAGVHNSRDLKYIEFMERIGRIPDSRFYRAANGIGEIPPAKEVFKLSGTNVLVDILAQFGITVGIKDSVIKEVNKELSEMAQATKSLSPYNVLAAYLAKTGFKAEWESSECIQIVSQEAEGGRKKIIIIGSDSEIYKRSGIDSMNPTLRMPQRITVPGISASPQPSLFRASRPETQQGPLYKTVKMLEHYLGVDIRVIADDSKAEFDQQAAVTQFPDLYSAAEQESTQHSIESSRRIGNVTIEIDGVRRTARTADVNSDKAVCEAIITACIDLIWKKSQTLTT